MRCPAPRTDRSERALWLALAFSCSALLVACGRAEERELLGAPPEGTEWLEAHEEHWDGWIELVPSIRTPRFADGRDRTSVYLRLPPGAQLTLADPDDPSSVEVPPGAELDRVERFSWENESGERVERVVDVRGTRFLLTHEELHVYRPMSATDPRLFGARWERVGSAPPDVVDAMRSAMLDGHGVAGTSPARRDAVVARFSALLACEGCHQPSAASRLDERREWPRRPTDASGLYSILATLSNRSVLETYRPRDDNEGSPFVATSCLPASPGCAAREATFDLAAALSASDTHAQAVCASRRAIARRASASLREAYREELSVCGAL